jgi:cell division septal protein FtsQ
VASSKRTEPAKKPRPQAQRTTAKTPAKSAVQTEGKPKKRGKRELSDIEKRRKERKRVHRRVIYRKLLKYVLICAALTALVWGLAFSSVFKVETVVYHGLDDQKFPVFVDQNQVDALTQKLTADSEPSLIVLNSGSLKKQYEAIPHVKTAQVIKTWPHQLDIVIEPKEPIARIGSKLIDFEGTELGEQPKDGKQFPEFVANDESKADTLTLLNSVHTDIADITKIEGKSRSEIIITHKTHDKDMQVNFGDLNYLTLKLTVLKNIEDSQDLNGKTVINISSPKDPSLK